MSVVIISKYNTTTKMYHPEFAVDTLAQAEDYIDARRGHWANLAKYPNEKTYTFDVVDYQSKP